VTELYGERCAPEAAAALATAIEAARGDGQLDDLVLLGALLDAGDDGVLAVLGSRCRRLIAAVDAARAGRAGEPDEPRQLPFADDLVTVAADEAFATGRSATVAPVHLLLALFAFPGTASEEILHQSGIEWRPLRSITRRLLRPRT
jgi:hypothetical protein